MPSKPLQILLQQQQQTGRKTGDTVFIDSVLQHVVLRLSEAGSCLPEDSANPTGPEEATVTWKAEL